MTRDYHLARSIFQSSKEGTRFSPADVEAYIHAISRTGALSSGFNYYRLPLYLHSLYNLFCKRCEFFLPAPQILFGVLLNCLAVVFVLHHYLDLKLPGFSILFDKYWSGVH